MFREDVVFVESFYKELKKNDIKYCILRNSDEIIEGNAHDIDMTIDMSKIDKAYFILIKTAKLLGWKMHLKTGTLDDENNIKCYHFYKVIEGKPILLHFDIFPTFTWKGIVLLSNEDLLENIEIEPVYNKSNPGVESVTKLFIRFLHQGTIKDKYKDYIKYIFETEKILVLKTMKKFISENTSQIIYDLVTCNRWDELENNRDYIILDIKQIAKSKQKYYKNKFNYKLYLCRKIIKKSGTMIVFEGCDGSGKTTIIENIPQVLNRTFNDDMIDYFHWRPGFIKSPKKESNNKSNAICIEPHKYKPYGKFVSIIKFMYFNLDFILGYWLKVRIALSKGKLVIFDRYYYDYYLDKIRYRLNISNKLLDFSKIFIPKPKITFLLVGEPKVLYERKREIPIEEIDKQIGRIIDNKDKFYNSHVINVNNDIETVVNEVCIGILENCNMKY